MQHYRVFCLDPLGMVIAAEDVEAQGDADALVTACGIAKGVTREVWDRWRLVGQTGDGSPHFTPLHEDLSPSGAAFA